MSSSVSYLKTLPLVEALWWFIENCDANNSDEFFYLRERYREEQESE